MLSADGPLLDSEQAALDLIGEAWGEESDMIVIPKSRLSPEFLDLKTKLLGQVAQKLVNYKVAAGFIGDFSVELVASKSLRDYFYETNKGRAMLFASDIAKLAELISANR